MKNWIDVLEVKGKKGIAKFYNLIFDENNSLVFLNSDILQNSTLRYRYSKESKALIIDRLDGIKIKLSNENVDKLNKCFDEMKDLLISFYKDIVLGKEKLICFPIELEGYPYYVTTETILNYGMCSPKFISGFEYAFSQNCLKKFGIKTSLRFDNYKDIQKKIGCILKTRNLKCEKYKGAKAIIMTLPELIDEKSLLKVS